MVVEANDGVGREASGANAGMIAPGHSFAWTSPKAPGPLVRSLLGKETAIRVRLTPDLRLYSLRQAGPPEEGAHDGRVLQGPSSALRTAGAG